MNEERIARIAAQKAEIHAETIHSSGVSEKYNEKEVFISDVANIIGIFIADVANIIWT